MSHCDGLLSDNVSRLLEKRGMNWSQLARRADLSLPTIYDIRNKPDYNVTISTIEKIADALGCTASDLLSTYRN